MAIESLSSVNYPFENVRINNEHKNIRRIVFLLVEIRQTAKRQIWLARMEGNEPAIGELMTSVKDNQCIDEHKILPF